MGRKIVINTIGTLGDLHPLIAVALELKSLGHEPVFATSHDYVEKLEKSGFEVHGIVDGHLKQASNLGFSEEEFMQKLMTNQKEMMDKFVLAPLSDSVKKLEQVMQGVEAVIGGPFSYAGQIMADKYQLPFIMTILQPGLISTCYDTMITPEFPMFIAPARNPVSRTWNRGWISLLKFAGRRFFSKSINAVRAEHGVTKKPSLPIFVSSDAVLFLGLYSDVLGGLQPDMFPNTQITGFPVFDSQSGAPEKLDPILERFLDDGPPPLVFGLGSLAYHAAGNFYAESVELSKRLQKRAVLLVGKKQGHNLKIDKDVHIADYAPHSQLFPKAVAIIHHGGIGSTGCALRHGKLQLITPFNGDQFDNARRVQRLGISETLPIKKFNATRAEKLLGSLLGNEDAQIKASQIQSRLQNENGAKNAAEIIDQCLR